MPKVGERAYPFPVLETCYNTPEALSALLPGEVEVYCTINTYNTRSHCGSFPHVPCRIQTKEVEDFLIDKNKKATTSPHMLALILATLAMGEQVKRFEVSEEVSEGLCDGEQTLPDKCDCYGGWTAHIPLHSEDSSLMGSQLPQACRRFVMARS